MTDQINSLAKVNEFFGNDMVKSRLASVLGERNTGPYIASVLLVVANNPKIQECTPASIYSAALQAATLRLSVDPSTGQAYIVPRKGKAVFQVGYRGLYHMAMRTGRYRYINVGRIYEGETVTENRLTGLHSIEGQRTGDKVLGWIGAFEMTNGFAHTVYWTLQEIHEHARKYSQAYSDDRSPWKTATARMEQKTVLSDLLRHWGYLDPSDRAALEDIEASNEEQQQEPAQLGRSDDDEVVDTTYTTQDSDRSEADLMAALGY